MKEFFEGFNEVMNFREIGFFCGILSFCLAMVALGVIILRISILICTIFK